MTPKFKQAIEDTQPCIAPLATVIVTSREHAAALVFQLGMLYSCLADRYEVDPSDSLSAIHNFMNGFATAMEFNNYGPETAAKLVEFTEKFQQEFDPHGRN